MNVALHIPELCDAIAREDTLRPADLYNLALVSRHWRDVAEAVLWEDVPDLLYLLSLFPRPAGRADPKAWTRTNSVNGKDPRRFKITRSLKPSDWDALLRKSLLVRKLTVLGSIPEDTQRKIIECPPPSTFLSNIRSLCVASPPVGDTVYPRRRFLASIVPLRILSCLRLDLREMHTNDIPRLLSACRSLQQLNFEANTRHVRIGFTGELIDALHDISHRLAALKLGITFKFPWSEGGHNIFLQRVSRLSNLVSLEINFFDNHQDDFRPPIVYTTPGFASLEELTLRGGYARTLVDIICSAPRRAMRRIDVKFASLDAAALEPICRVLNKHCVHDVLRELCLHTWSSSGQTSLQSFRPLEAFDALEFRYLDWVFPSSRSLDEAIETEKADLRSALRASFPLRLKTIHSVGCKFTGALSYGRVPVVARHQRLTTFEVILFYATRGWRRPQYACSICVKHDRSTRSNADLVDGAPANCYQPRGSNFSSSGLMHIALCIPEICALIARESVLESTDLARLALVSRAWREVAEEVLWEDLPDILCLLRLLPEDLWYTETQTSQDGFDHSAYEMRILRREIEPMDWTSLLRKSGLVKFLTVTNFVSVEVQQAIIKCPSPPNILRRLRTLHLTTSTDATFLGAFVPLDTITALRITYSGASIHSSTASLLNSCTNVTSLTLKLHLVGASKQTKAVALLTAVTEAKRVQRLSLLLTMEFALPSERFMHFMSQLPALTNLDIRLNRCEGAKDYRTITYASPSFVHLRTLKLSRHSTQMLAEILRASSPSHLRVIVLVYFALEEGDVEPLISTICMYCARSTLRKLSISASNFFGSADWRCLTPLAAFEQLEVRFMDQAVPYTCPDPADR
ncbi:hypothetical protein K525DRAFT_207799 [Schizophyllum commune Loenen D]|nr:hypothetical protein K525DRAFT_207799 [Schizophyllum commune Loenen D]